MFLQRKIKFLILALFLISPFTYAQVDTAYYFRQWEQGINLLDKDFKNAHLMIEDAIFGFANQKYWKSATYKALHYSKILIEKKQNPQAQKWIHYAGEWGAEKLGNLNVHYCQVLENASLLNFLNGDFFSAYNLLKKSIKIYQNCETKDQSYLLKLHQNIATWSENLGNWEDAYASYHFLYHYAENTKDYLVKLANIAYENMDYWNAKDYFILLLKEKYRDSTLYLKLTECYLHFGKSDSAEYYFQNYYKKVKDLSIESFSLKYFEIKAWMAKQAQAYQEAIDALQLGLQHPKITPFQKIQFYWNIGKTWSDLGLLENAEAQYKSAIILCSDTLFIKYLISKDLAELYLKKAQWVKAEELLLPVHHKFHKFLGRFHIETLSVDELLGRLYFQKKEFEKSLYFYQLALDNSKYHHDLQIKTLKIYRKIIQTWLQIYHQKQNYAVLKEVLSIWKSYIKFLEFTLQYPHHDEELFFEIQNGLFEASETYLEAYFRKSQIQHLHTAYYCHWLWKKIKQKSLQQYFQNSETYQNLVVRKKMLQNLMVKETTNPEYSAMKLNYWSIMIDSLNQQIQQTSFQKPIWFDPHAKSLFSTDEEECQIAYFIGNQQWMIFFHYQDQLFFKYFPDNYELKNHLYLLKKGNENPDNVSTQVIQEKISEMLLEFPLNKIQHFKKIKTLNFSFDEPMFHIELEKLYVPNTQRKLFLTQKYNLQKKLAPF